MTKQLGTKRDSEPWTDEQVKGTLEAHGISGITRAHNATLQPARASEEKKLNTKQIAEEAWKCIKNLPEDLQFYDEEGQAIIQNYIEKATEGARDENTAHQLTIARLRKERDAWKRVANWDESRAAHASEPTNKPLK